MLSKHSPQSSINKKSAQTVEGSPLTSRINNNKYNNPSNSPYNSQRNSQSQSLNPSQNQNLNPSPNLNLLLVLSHHTNLNQNLSLFPVLRVTRQIMENLMAKSPSTTMFQACLGIGTGVTNPCLAPTTRRLVKSIGWTWALLTTRLNFAMSVA
jgi:hypothetical protein